MVTDAFGIVALVALAPLIAIQIMGLIYARRERAASIPREMMEETDDDIVVEIEEE